MNYYKQGLEELENKNYKKAIGFFLSATLVEKEYSFEIYHQLAIAFEKENKFKEAIESLLMIDNRQFKIKNSQLNIENREFLYKYIIEHEPLGLKEWLELAKKAEELKCWSVASYAYMEFFFRDNNFTENWQFKLVYSLFRENRYKEAFYHLKYLKSNNSNLEYYRGYREYFMLDDKIILYLDVSNSILKFLETIRRDVYFDSYRHIVVVDKNGLINNIKNDILIIQKNSNLYKRYLAMSKYIIGTEELPKYFKRREEQTFLFIGNGFLSPIEASHFMNLNSSILDAIQEIFFENRKDFPILLKRRESEYRNLYELAIEEFKEKKWYSSHIKFKKIAELSKDITKKLPTLYYIKETHIQKLIEDNKGSLETLIPYGNYQFSAENFVGIKTLLINLEKKDPLNWSKVLSRFIPILEEMKKCDRKAIRYFINKKFLKKVEFFSNSINSNLEAKLLPYQVWFVFADLFIFARLYKKYQLSRKKALYSILENEGELNLNQKRYKINALSEISDEKRYIRFRDELLNEYSKTIKKDFQLLGFSELYFNRRDKSIEFLKEFYNEDDKIFSKYIEGKSIAIVGPVKSKLNLGEEIDKHDVVIRFNYNGLDNSLYKNIGKKTDVSYYITEVLIRDKFDNKKIEKMNKLDWVIFDTLHKKSDICFLGVKSNLRQRSLIAHSHLNPYFKGTANAIQRTILDLVRFNTGNIKIYNSNLFLESGYHKDYKTRGSLGADHLIFNFHDPLSNFIFLKRLKEFNIIEVDSVLNEILKMDESQYINALEDRYGIR